MESTGEDLITTLRMMVEDQDLWTFFCGLIVVLLVCLMRLLKPGKHYFEIDRGYTHVRNEGLTLPNLDNSSVVPAEEEADPRPHIDWPPPPPPPPVDI